MAFTIDLTALVFLQALHAGTFATCHLGAMAFIQRSLPAGSVALGQSLYYALGGGATGAIVFQVSGLLYARFGQQAFLAMTVLCLLGTLAVVLLARQWHGGLLIAAQPANASARAP